MKVCVLAILSFAIPSVAFQARKTEETLASSPSVAAPLTSTSYSCESGQTQFQGPYLFQTGEKSQADCEARCASTEGCVAFDYTNKKGSDACRGVQAGQKARMGQAGKDNRLYCLKAYTCEKNKNYMSREDPEDLASHSGVQSQFECANLCENTNGCNAHVFNKYGTCFLKASVMHVLDDDPVHETVSCRKDGYTCESNKNYMSDDDPEHLGLHPVHSQFECANLCEKTEGCNVHVFNKYGACYLKTRVRSVLDEDAVHETVSCRKALPAEDKCESWCNDHKASWGAKCAWSSKACGVCAQCQAP